MKQHKFSPTGATAVYAEAMAFTRALDMHREIKQKNIVTAGAGAASRVTRIHSNLGAEAFQSIDLATMIAASASSYHISANMEDYVLVPVIAMPTDIPNRNGVGFPLTELKAWRPEEGMIAYQTFRGKPVHIEHDNQDCTKAVGIIIDASLRPMIGFGGGALWKVMLLLAIDRNKDPVYANYVLSGEINSYSMGAWVENYTCGYCMAPMGQCNHLHPRQPRDFYILNGRLVYRRVHGIKGFECSIVSDPAYLTAISDKLMVMG